MSGKTDFQNGHPVFDVIEQYKFSRYENLNDNYRDIPAIDIEKIQDHFDRLLQILIKEYVFLRYYNRQSDLKAFLNQLEKELIQYALLFSSGVQKKAAHLLRVKQTSLFEKIKRFKLRPEKCRQRNFQNDMISEMDRFLVRLHASLY